MKPQIINYKVRVGRGVKAWSYPYMTYSQACQMYFESCETGDYDLVELIDIRGGRERVVCLNRSGEPITFDIEEPPMADLRLVS